MAYTATVTVQRVQIAGHLGYQLKIAETEAAQTSETEIVLANVGLPSMGRVFSQQCILSTGTGTTINPVIGNTTDPANARWQMANETAAARVHNQSTLGVQYGGDVTSFFHRAQPNNATADHTIETVYYIRAGWRD